MPLDKAADSPGINSGWKLFGVIFIINIIQSVFTPLLNDEPYYWLYSKYLSWGYFDHPPMIAFLIKLGSTVLPGEMGVRLLAAILGSLTFFLVYKLIEGEAAKPLNFKVAALLLFSSLFLNLYSFLAIPDTAMLFFAALFLYSYRRYLNADTLINTLVLGLVTALLLYSKYHGILLVGFTVLSNIRLLARRSFYIVFVIALVLFIPHINWQIQHDYPTIRFQFFERSGVFNLQHVFSYLGEQAAVTGPLILLIFSILYKPQSQFQKALKYNVAGVFLFFLFSSFKEMVNVHWTAIAWPSMLCLSYLYISQLKSKAKLVTGLLIFNLIIVIILRVNFIGNFFSLSNFNDKNPQLLTSKLKEMSNGNPLVFRDLYNEPSYFIFYGHVKSFAINDASFKKTQFNYLPQLETEFQGKTISLVSTDSVNSSSKKVIIPKGKKYFVTMIPNFTSFNTSIKVNALNFTNTRASAENSITLSVENSLTAKEKNLYYSKKGYLLLTFINNQTRQSFYYKYDKPLDIDSKAPFDFKFKAPAIKGNYSCIFSIMTNDSFSIGFNSNVYNCKVN